jgi:phosphatidate cytidylyltransferase
MDSPTPERAPRGPVTPGDGTGVGVAATGGGGADASDPAAAPAKRQPRAGRELSAAIPVGIGLITVLVLSLAFRPEPFVVLVGVVALLGSWEIRGAARQRDIVIDLVPVAVGSIAIVAATWFLGVGGQVVAYVAAVGVVSAVALLRRGGSGGILDASVDVFTLTYVPFLVSFAVLMVRIDDGYWLVLTTALLAASNDTGGYVFGMLFGKHPMAPTISPKKSWEGVAGSVVTTVAASWILVTLVQGYPWWLAVVLGVAVVCTATLGDLAESLLKRDLGVKDMSNLLPGHGGLFDRLDSIVVTLPLVYLALGPLARAAT